MNVSDIFTGKNYVYKKPDARHGLPVEAIATDASRNMVLVLNLNTRKTMRVNAADLSPLKPKQGSAPMNQDELIAKLTPAIGLRRQLDPRAHPKSDDCAEPIVTIRQLRPAERNFADGTLDTILVERETDPWHDQPYGLVAASSHTIRLTWFPGTTPTTIRLLAEGISALTGKPAAYVQIFHGSEDQINAAKGAAQATKAWSPDDLIAELETRIPDTE